MQVSVFTNVYSNMPQETSLEDLIATIRSSSKLYKLTTKVREHLKSGLIDKATKIKKAHCLLLSLLLK